MDPQYAPPWGREPPGLWHLSRPDLDLLQRKDTEPCWLSRIIHDETSLSSTLTQGPNQG